MSKLLYTLVGVIIIILIAWFVYTWTYKASSSHLAPSSATSQNSSAAQTSTSNSVITEIVSPQSTGTNFIRHSFSGEVQGVAVEGENQKITLYNSNQHTVPDFVVLKSTLVWTQAGSKFNQAAASDIKPGSHVELHVNKNADGSWVLKDVYILE